jgi:hypothetical protein
MANIELNPVRVLDLLVVVCEIISERTDSSKWQTTTYTNSDPPRDEVLRILSNLFQRDSTKPQHHQNSNIAQEQQQATPFPT